MYEMHWSSRTVLVAAIGAGIPSWVNGQQSGWVVNQVNTTMCAWKALRAAQLKDTAYLDGGFLYWVRGLADGTTSLPVQDGNLLGFTYTLNFSIPFDSNTNVSNILNSISATPGAANNIKPNYYDGAMLANDHEFFLYGGLIKKTGAYTPPDDDDVVWYRASDYGVPKQDFRPGFGNGKLPDGMTRYVTFGGAANAPSENKAWYFGGSRSPSWGPIYQPGGNDSLSPTNVSNTLITLDLSESQSEKWTNVTLPPGIPSRANPSTVWVPVGDQGILVVLGGVAYPEYSNTEFESQNPAQSKKVSPGYMINIDIYDVASREWYQQPTTGTPPPQSAMGCAVVGTAEDLSSYNIYYYGGFDGLDENVNFRDEVWVLSLPSFTWTMLSQGNDKHARAGHQCLTPYPDQMVTIGGFRSPQGGPMLCLDDGILQVFNLTAGEWKSSYDPKNWNKYGVPEVIHNKIGGGYAGGATATTPTPSGWAATELASIFATKYQTSKITTYYPYSSQSPGNETRGGPEPGKGGGGTPTWVAVVLGVVLGLVFLTAIVVGILLYRRRSIFRKRNSGTESSRTDERHHYIRKWLNYNPEKAPTITTSDPPSHFDGIRSQTDTPMPSVTYSVSPNQMTEMPGNGPSELDGTSPPLELGGQELSHTHILAHYTKLHSPSSPHSGSPHADLKSPSFFTGSVSQDQPSSLSSSQAGINSSVAAAAMARERADSPPLGRASPIRTPNRDTVVSDMSRTNEHHMSHLRNLSAGTVSSTSNSGPSPPTTPPAMQMAFGPVSPPLPSPPGAPGDYEASDYVSMYQSMEPTSQQGSNAHTGPARGSGANSSLRFSVFREDSEGLGDKPSQTR